MSVDGPATRYATLACGQNAVLAVENPNTAARCAEAGLRTVTLDWDSLTVTPAPVWLLPPTHARFRFSPQRAIDTAGLDPVDLWPGGVWSPDAFDKVLESRRTNSWWLRWLPDAEPRLVRRVRQAGPVLAQVRQTVAERYPGASLVATVLNGSYLWRERPSSAVDVVAVLSDVADHTLDHDMSVALPPDAWPTVDGTTVDSLDLLVVGDHALREPERLTGTIGAWNLPDGSPFPYDLSRATIARAIRHTLAAGITIDGRDYFARVGSTPTDLVALAYYFTQEASILLAWRTSPAKAAQRLQEANLICRQVEETLGVGGRSDLDVAAARCAAEAPRETPGPSWLASVQGWLHGPPDSILARTVRRLARLAHRVTVEPARVRPAADRLVVSHLASETVLACLRTEAVTEAGRGLAALRDAAEHAVGTPGWRQVRQAVTDHPLRTDIVRLTALLRTDPDRVAAAVRPGRIPDGPDGSSVTDELLVDALLWCRFGRQLLPLRPLPPSPSLPAMCVADALRMLTGACLAAIGPSPAAAVGDPWTAHFLEEQW